MSFRPKGPLFLLLWLAAVGGGFGMLVHYEVTPGRAAAANIAWPRTELIPAPAGKPVLVMAVHPECPCSQASVGELEKLVAHFPGRLACCILFVPAGEITAQHCRDSGLWKTAANIPGVTPMVDEGKIACLSFGAQTSGQVFLYDGAGKLRFSGGITGARGHAGANDGIDAITLFLNTGKAQPAHTPVYGCSLQ